VGLELEELEKLGALVGCGHQPEPSRVVSEQQTGGTEVRELRVPAGGHLEEVDQLEVVDQGVGNLDEDLSKGDMDPADARIVQALAEIATISLLQERAMRRGEALTGQLQEALNSRIAIEQAKGALGQIHSCTIDEAFELMRTYARSNGDPRAGRPRRHHGPRPGPGAHRPPQPALTRAVLRPSRGSPSVTEQTE
jgi:hypothetical protein